MSIVPTLFLGVEYCATFQAALYIETHSLMHQSEFHAASVALSRAADKNRSVRLCALKFASCKRSSFRSKQAKLEIAATDRSLLGELAAPR